MKTDIEIALSAKMKPIKEVAKDLGLKEDSLELYGNFKAKINVESSKKKSGKLILVTAMNPTPYGEGKTTTSIGLADAINKLGENVCLALREPSLGPVFGIKGGACGGGYAQVVPMEDINLHFTGDMHAIGAANNLLCAIIDNHIFQGNELNIDNRKIVINRALDMNDRQLRHLTNGLGGKVNGVPREDSFDITVASEIMAILCLSNDLNDLKKNLSNMLVAYKKDDTPVFVKDLGVEGALATLLKDAIKPNLTQTLENTPALIHGGPFANIAHGCNSIVATKLALSCSDYVVTEAGFGADLGAEKFLDIKCRKAGLKPSVVVIVATIRALKHHGGFDGKNNSLKSLKDGLPNLLKHVKNIKNEFNLPVVVSINKFPDDKKDEIALLKNELKKINVKAELSEVFSKGGKGGVSLAKTVLSEIKNSKSNLKFTYKVEESIEEKIKKIAVKIYGAKDISITPNAIKQIEVLKKLKLDKLPICIAKTQYSFSDNPKLLGAPKGFVLNVRDIKVSAGAGFIVALTGDIMRMPGLPKKPAALSIDINKNGEIKGLF